MDDSTNIMEGPTLSNGETPSSNTTGRKNSSPRVTKRAASLAKDGLSKRVKTAKSQNAREKMPVSSAKGTLGGHQQPNTSNPNLTLRALGDPVNTAEAKLQMVVRSEYKEQRESNSSHKVCSEKNSCHLPVKLTQTIKEETDMLENFREETNEMEIKEETDELEIKEESLEEFSERWDVQLSDKCQKEEYDCRWQVLPDVSDNDLPSGELERAEDSVPPDDDGSEKKRKPPRNEINQLSSMACLKDLPDLDTSVIKEQICKDAKFRAVKRDLSIQKFHTTTTTFNLFLQTNPAS